jgi:hypothetical protein
MLLFVVAVPQRCALNFADILYVAYRFNNQVVFVFVVVHLQRGKASGDGVQVTFDLSPLGFVMICSESGTQAITATREWIQALFKVVNRPPQLACAWKALAGLDFPMKPVGGNCSDNMLMLYGDVRCVYNVQELPYTMTVHTQYKKLVRDISQSTATKEVWIDSTTRQVCHVVDKRQPVELSMHAPLQMHVDAANAADAKRPRT